jgi:hypothetical protein
MKALSNIKIGKKIGFVLAATIRPAGGLVGVVVVGTALQ